MSDRIKRLTAILGASALVVASVAGCSANSSANKGSSDSASTESATSGTSGSTGESNATATQVSATRLSADDMFTDRDKEVGYDESTAAKITLSDSGSSCDSDAVTIDGSTVTITAEGTYILSGSLSDGQVQVNAGESDKVQLVLDGVNITTGSSAAIYVAQADKVFITLADGSENTLTTSGDFVAIDDNNIDGAIFAKSDLTLNGEGSLTVSCAAKHGIVSKKDLKITSGSYTVTAANHALTGENSVRIADGSFTLTAGKDGIHSEDTENAEHGFIYIAGGTISINCDDDGIDASSVTQLAGGSLTINSSAAKGIKAESAIFLDNATANITVADDAIHSNGDLEISGGSYTISAGDDGLHADNDLVVNDGTIEITKSYEGLEGITITVNGGDISVVSSDDGFNAAGGNDNSGFGGNDSDGWGGRGGGGMMDTDENANLTINGGTIHVDAGGDGVDSNGYITVNGGATYVAGPVNDGNAALDYGLAAYMYGGTFIAVGTSGMAENFDSSSTQCVLMATLDNSTSGTITLTDSDGNTLLTFDDSKTYNNIVVSTPEMKTGETYTITAGSETVSVEQSDTISTYGTAGGMGGGMGAPGGGGGFGGRKGSFGGQQPDGDTQDNNSDSSDNSDGNQSGSDVGDNRQGGRGGRGGFGGKGGFGGQLPDGQTPPDFADGDGGFGQAPDGRLLDDQFPEDASGNNSDSTADSNSLTQDASAGTV